MGERKTYSQTQLDFDFSIRCCGYPAMSLASIFNWCMLFNDHIVDSSSSWPFIIDESGSIRVMMVEYFTKYKKWLVDVIMPHEMLHPNQVEKRLSTAQATGTI